MSHLVRVERADGTPSLKDFDDLAPEDSVVLDGAGAFELCAQLQAELDAEIGAAGGVEAWRATTPRLSNDS